MFCHGSNKCGQYQWRPFWNAVQHSHACESRFSLADPRVKRYKGLGVKFAQGSEDRIDRKALNTAPSLFFGNRQNKQSMNALSEPFFNQCLQAYIPMFTDLLH